MKTLLDIHTHTVTEHAESTRVCNYTLPRDANLPLPSGLISVGLHPWFASAKDWMWEFEQVRMLATSPNVIMIGECGFDALVINRLPILTQRDIVEAHLKLAEGVQKQIIFHCVRAFPELFRTLKNAKPTVGTIIHGFNAKPDIAAEFVELGCYLSFGAAILNPHSNATQTLKKTPIYKICLETDDADLPIERIFAAASEQLNIPLTEFIERIALNFNDLSKYE